MDTTDSMLSYATHPRLGSYIKKKHAKNADLNLFTSVSIKLGGAELTKDYSGIFARGSNIL